MPGRASRYTDLGQIGYLIGGYPSRALPPEPDLPSCGPLNSIITLADDKIHAISLLRGLPHAVRSSAFRESARNLFFWDAPL